MSKIYVGNLSFSVSNESLEGLFQQYGSVKSASVIIDRTTGRSKGFGFIEMAEQTDATKAIDALNGQQFEGRNLTVSEARPQEPRDNNRGGGSRGGFGGGGGNFGGGNRW